MSAEALMVCSWLPFPITSGGRKRTARLAEAMVRAGATPVLLSLEPASPAALQEISDRGWKVHAPQPSGGAYLRRLPQHMRALPFADSPSLVATLRHLAPRAAFVQLEEARSFQYARFLPSGTRSAMSAHNVDSRVIDTTTPRGRSHTPSSWSAA